MRNIKPLGGARCAFVGAGNPVESKAEHSTKEHSRIRQLSGNQYQSQYGIVQPESSSNHRTNSTSTYPLRFRGITPTQISSVRQWNKKGSQKRVTSFSFGPTRGEGKLTAQLLLLLIVHVIFQRESIRR
ncbi:hypothetical protein OUZ56_031749 [Daphnia magna]|uniref:Uncharacterized protein n=1 Tax=Daphnia magna TaxID=35525 RepID=A0ABQ9ZV70_9CRUS|nr:hypothetical protein OUZ56_031749 [Daphnia magna]